jgi:oxygen-independent coproporphyrinogen-3 oxidase
LDFVEEIQPASVTASDLRVHKGTAFFSMEKGKFASEAELIEMHSAFIERMLSLGYEQSFPYQFVKKGFRMKFLENQWSNREFIGFGASSCSYFLGWDYNNFFPAERYFKQLEEKGLALAVGKRLSKREQMVRAMALGLKNADGVDKFSFKKNFGQGLEEIFGDKLKALEGLGLIESSGQKVRLSSKGVLFYDSVSRKFFEEKALT